jgi:general secretion pathway protein F
MSALAEVRVGRRAGAAVRDIEEAARLLGPALIMLLGGLIGLMMAGLLSGVTELGQAALN